MTKLFILLCFIVLGGCNSSNGWECVNGNCQTGYGERVWTDGGYEKGFWVDGKLFGTGNQFFGTTSKFSGDTYSGIFMNNKYEGTGTYYSRKVDIKYVGEWIDGKMDGKGVLSFGEKSRVSWKVL